MFHGSRQQEQRTLFSRLPISFSLASRRASKRCLACSATVRLDSSLASPSSVSLCLSISRWRWCSMVYSKLQTLAASAGLLDCSGSSEGKPNAARRVNLSGKSPL